MGATHPARPASPNRLKAGPTVDCLSFEAFVVSFRSWHDLAPDLAMTTATRFDEDLAFDSLSHVESMALLFDLGADVDDDAIVSTDTLGELYSLYTIGRSRIALAD